MLTLLLFSASVSAEYRLPTYNLQQERVLVLDAAKKFIILNEGTVKLGNRHIVYDDAHGKLIASNATVKGIPTIGYGRNLMSRGLSEEEAQYLLANDLAEVYDDLSTTYPWFEKLSPNRQVAMVDLRYNMGAGTLAEFKKFLAAMAKSDYSTASAELVDSSYGRKQVKRSTLNRELIKNG